MTETLKIFLTDRYYSLKFEGKGLYIFSILTCVAFIATGHFVALTHEVVWLDELLSVIYANGHTVDEIYEKVFHLNHTATSQLISNLLVPQGNVLDVLKNLYQFYPLQQPLYYLILRKWIGRFGMTAPVFVSLSVLMHLTCIFCASLFFKLLYEYEIQRSIAILIVLIGPLEITFARDARPYMLWMNMFFLANYFYLKMLRNNSPSACCIYTISMIFALYTSLFAVPLACAHLALMLYRRLARENIQKMLVSLVIQTLCFLPWVYLSLRRGFSSIDRQIAWVSDFDMTALLMWWKYNSLSMFYYFPKVPDSTFRNGYLFLPGLCFSILLFLLIRFRGKLWVQFLMALLLTGTVPLVAWDLVWGGVHSAAIRYQLATFLSLQACLAGFLGMGLHSSKKVHQWTARIMFFILCGLNILWNFDFVKRPLHPDSEMEPALNYLLNQKDGELVVLSEPIQNTRGITEGRIAATLALVYNLPEQMHVRWINSSCEFRLQKNKKTFLFTPVDSQVTTRNLIMEPAVESPRVLWILRGQNCS